MVSTSGHGDKCALFSGIFGIEDTDTVSISESGKDALNEKTDSVQTGTDNGIFVEEAEDAVKTEPVIYTKTGEALKLESGTNLSASV